MDRSVEKQARRALHKLVFMRILNACFGLPKECIIAVCNFGVSFANLFREIEMSLYYYELDAARRYRLLTGTDMGVASGNERRYIGTHPDAWEDAVSDMQGDTADLSDEDEQV